MNKLPIPFVGLLVLALVGCETMPPMDFTVRDVGIVPIRKNVELKSVTVGFAPQSQQGNVDLEYILYATRMGDPLPVSEMKPVQPVWKEGLRDAINRSLIFRDDMPIKVSLSVRITDFYPPGGSLDGITVAAAIYEIIDRDTGDLLFSELIKSKGVTPFSTALNGWVRLRESANLAIRNNIANFINRLQNADLSKPIYRG